MGRRRNSSLMEGVISAGGAMPPMVSIVIALVFFLAAEPLVQAIFREALDPNSPSQAFTGLITGMLVTVCTILFKYFIRGALLLGALVSWIKQKIAARLLGKARNAVDALSEHADGAQQALKRFSWREFEQITSAYFHDHGYQVQVTDDGPDGGVDVILYKNGYRYFVQCKHWRVSKVPLNVVRELYGVIMAEGAAGGVVVASGRFTEDAAAFAKGKNIQLLDGDTILKHRPAPPQPATPRFSRPTTRVEPTLNSGTLNTPLPETPKPKAPACPKCASPTVLRTAKEGAHAGVQFYGCVHFPQCRGAVRV